MKQCIATCCEAGLIVLLLVVPSAEAANKYVRAGASGTATGADWTNAYATLPTTLTRGDTYYIADGSYGSYTFDDPTSGTTLITIVKATESSHGTSTGWQSSYGDGRATFSQGWSFRTSYWLVDGQTGGGPMSWTSGFGFAVNASGGAVIEMLNAAGNITLRHVDAYGNGPDGNGGSASNDIISIFGGSNITISYAYLHDAGRCLYFLSGKDLIFEYIYGGRHESTASEHSEIASIWNFYTTAERITFRHSVYTHAEGTGGLIMEGNGLYVYGNVFYRGSTGWSHNNGLIGTWTVSTLTNTKVYNNAFINIVDGPVFGFLYSGTGGNEARNNVFYGVTSTGLGSLFPTYSHNHYVNSNSPGSETGKTTGTVNPFVNYPALDFRLTAPTTPGMTLASPYNLDWTGSVRGADGTWDRGAVEFGGSTIPLPAAPSNLRILP